MAFQGRRVSAVLLLALLPFFVLSVHANKVASLFDSQWDLSKPNEAEPLLQPFKEGTKYLEESKAGAKFRYSPQCEFTFPSRHGALDAAYGVAANVTKVIYDKVARLAAEGHGDGALVKVAEAIGGRGLRGVDSINNMLSNLHPLWSESSGGQGTPIGGFESFKQKVKSCYGQKLHFRVACLANLETLTFTTYGWGQAWGHSLHVFPLALTAAAMYPLIALDYMAALKACGSTVIDGVVSRITGKANRIATNVYNNVTEAALDSLFPQPLINDRDTLEAERTVRAFHGMARVLTINSELEDAARWWWTSAPFNLLKSYHQMSICTEHDGRHTTICAPATRTFSQKHEVDYSSSTGFLSIFTGRRATDVSLAAFRLSAYNACVVEGRRTHRLPEDGLRTDLETFAFMQSRVEKYYKDGAPWAKKNIVQVAEHVHKIYKKLPELLAHW